MGEWPRALEGLVIDPASWVGRHVFLTGHTGFKGAWLSLLLKSLGARVSGFALPPQGKDDIFNVAGVVGDVVHRIGDIRDFAQLRDALGEAKPDVVVHMAAQALVRHSYREPVETYATNVMGTVHLLEAVRQVSGIQATIVVTSDKCYENTGASRGYSEEDPMGGYDPYSSSKGCAEIVAAAYQRSFFHGEAATPVATVRAGNVIGGGDWALDRLVPDVMRSFMSGKAVRIRNPTAIRPWQHVMDPLIGYLTLAQHMISGGHQFAEGWNFGPHADSEVPVSVLVENLARHWGADAHWLLDEGNNPHEAAYLKLDCAKAQTRLNWNPVVGFDQALNLSAEWYRAFHGGEDMRAITLRQIEKVVTKAGLQPR